MPLQRTRGDKSWGRVDLVGMSNDCLPVVFELKKGASAETPLRMIIEALAYAIAIRKSWNEGNFRDEWIEVVGNKVPKTLLEIPVIGIAPTSYWKTKIGEPKKRTNGKVRDAAWKPFSKLCQMISDRGFPVSFWQFETGDEIDEMISIDSWSSVDIPDV